MKRLKYNDSERAKFKIRKASRSVCRNCPTLESILLKSEHGYTLADIYNWRNGLTVK